MLVQFALTAFALFGIAALTIDMGLARLTQSQMQTAADSAALEGVRYRNVSEDGFESDCRRRFAAWKAVTQVFQDNGTQRFGAGPEVSLAGGTGEADAFAQIQEEDVAHPHPYKPSLQFNQTGNAAHGDMVSGHFTYDADPPPDEGQNPDQPDDPYDRMDFVPAPDSPPPGDSGVAGCPPPDDPAYDDPLPWPASNSQLSSGPNDAFLVRLRRTTGPGGLDNEPDVSSSGPTLPWLFARGTTIHTDPASGSTRNIRQDGITVRATAIAGTAPALAVGAPTASTYGTAPFVLTSEFFASLTSTSTSVQVQDGTIVQAGLPVGRFLAVPLTNVGQSVPDANPTCTETSPTARFVPLYGAIGASLRVIGFGRIEWDSDCPTSALTLSRPEAQVVVDANATAHLSAGLPADLPVADIPELMARNRALSDSGLGLLVPTLVR
jgi:hypothetical protein